MTATKTAIVLLADGVEEIECLTTVNVLRRGEVKVTLAGLCSQVKGSRNIVIVADALLDNVANNDYDAVVLPGGQLAVENLMKSEALGELLKRHECNDKIIAAVCAGPLVLKKNGIAKSKSITSYPTYRSEFGDNYKYSDAPVVVDENIITSRGPGTTMAFALCILEKLMGNEIRERVANALLYQPHQ